MEKSRVASTPGVNGETPGVKSVLIASVTPYFLERSYLWFEENIKQILEARKTQSFFQDNTAYMEINKKIGLSEFLRKIDEMGYEKVQTISGPGEFSRRGGIIDIFPLNINCAVKIEFFGNSIENIERLPIAIENEKEAKELLAQNKISTFSSMREAVQRAVELAR